MSAPAPVGGRVIALRLALVPGICRWCGTTTAAAWRDVDHTLCDECGPFDACVCGGLTGRRRAVTAFRRGAAALWHEGRS